MTNCTKCGIDIGEAHVCPSCGEAAAQPTPQAPMPAPTGQPLPGQYHAGQPAYNQPHQQMPSAQHVKKTNPLMIIAGIALIVLALFSAAQAIAGIVNFMSLISSYSTYISMDLYPWPSVIFGLFVDVVMIATGILAILFSKRTQRATIVVVAAAATGGLVLIRCFIYLTSLAGSLIDFGFEYFDFDSSIVFGLLTVPYVVSVLLSVVLLLLALAAAVMLFIGALSARKQQTH